MHDSSVRRMSVSIRRVRRLTRWMTVLTFPFVALVLLVSSLRAEPGVAISPRGIASSQSLTQSSYLYRFDPASQTFFTVALPLGSVPYGVAVTGTNPTHVWLADYGRDRIGHLIYTSTSVYQWIEYPVTSTVGSGPYRIALHGDRVWFTERGANRIGRLNANSGQIEEFFAGLTPGSNLADIQVAPNGWVWAAGQSSNRLIRLVVTSTVDYSFREYTHTLLAGPYGVSVESDNAIWVASPSSHRVGRLTPSDGSFLWPFTFPTDSTPTEIVAASSIAWFSDPQRNAIGQLQVGTLPNLIYYPSISRPVGLASESPSRFWLTQQTAQGAVGRFIFTSTSSTQFDSFPLPVSGLQPTGISVAPDKGVWFAAYTPSRLFLPVVLADYPPPVPPFAIQMYGSITASTGFTRLVEAGAHWIRFPIYWSNVEPTNTTPEFYNWTNLDNSVQTIVTSDVRIIATIENNPSWASAAVDGPVTNTADLHEFVGAVVARYPQIEYWEFYNEPDRKDTRFGLKGAAYANMLKSVYPLVKSANPRAQVVLGGLAMDWFIENGGPFDASFLPTVLANCAGSPCFDIANFHYYPPFRPNWEAYGRDIIGKATYMRQLLASYGFNRPVINTELGWPAGLAWGSADLAARYVAKAYARSYAANLPVANWFALVDADYSDPGLLGPGLVPRSAHTAYRVLTSLLGGARFVRAISSSETGSPRIEGYQFSVPATVGRKRLDVYWYDCPSMYTPSLFVNGSPADCTTRAALRVAASQVAVIDHMGGSVFLKDADDGLVDGRVTIPNGGVDTNPIYIDYAP